MHALAILFGLWGLFWAIAVVVTWRYRERIVPQARPIIVAFVMFFGLLNAIGSANYLIHEIIRGARR